MYIKRYTVAALIFVVLLGWYVYAFITQDTFAIDFFGIPLPSLSIALWVVIPVILFYIASVVHISFYSLIGSFKLRKYEKDYEKLLETFIDAYLGKNNRNHMFKTPRYKLLGALIDNSTILLNQTFKADTSSEKLNNAIKLIESIKKGEVVDLKKYSLEADNALVIQNNRNQYKKGNISSEDILSNASKYAKSLCEEAYADFVKTAPLYAIEKYSPSLTKESLFTILARVNASENILEVSNEALISLFNSLKLDVKDYLKISIALSKQMVPEQRIKLFETLCEDKEEATDAYLFTLFDLEMIAPADEILENSQPQEYSKFKAYRALKECNKHFNINLFI